MRSLDSNSSKSSKLLTDSMHSSYNSLEWSSENEPSKADLKNDSKSQMEESKDDEMSSDRIQPMI